MRTRDRVVSLLLAAPLLAILAASPVWAASEVPPGGTFITVDPNATGTKVSGTVTVYYESVGNTFLRLPADQCTLPEFEVDMFFFMRLQKGSQTPVGFAGREQTTLNAKICVEDLATQEIIIRAFVAAQVIPFFFPNSPAATFAVRSVNNLVQDRQFPISGSLFFAILDIDARVKE